MYADRYILFLWLSILVLIPFDLRRLDGDKDPGYTVKRMLRVAFVSCYLLRVLRLILWQHKVDSRIKARQRSVARQIRPTPPGF